MRNCSDIIIGKIGDHILYRTAMLHVAKFWRVLRVTSERVSIGYARDIRIFIFFSESSLLETYLDVSHTMIVEVGRGRKLLTANETLMRFFTTVDSLVRIQRARRWETLVAHHTNMRFLSFNLTTKSNYLADVQPSKGLRLLALSIELC